MGGEQRDLEGALMANESACNREGTSRSRGSEKRKSKSRGYDLTAEPINNVCKLRKWKLFLNFQQPMEILTSVYFAKQFN